MLRAVTVRASGAFGPVVASVKSGSDIYWAAIRHACTAINSPTSDDRLHPRRALMYVPASDSRKLAKIEQLRSDCIVIDCEDAVPSSLKDTARRMGADFVNSGVRPPTGELGIRVNSVTSGFLEDDLEVLGSNCTAHFPDAIMLPKVDSADDLHRFSVHWKRMSSKNKLLQNGLIPRLVFWVESATALIHMNQICEAAAKLRVHAGISAEAVVFGSDDYCASIGAHRSKHGMELLYARQKFVCISKAYGFQAIDSVFIDFKDSEGLRRQCKEGVDYGFTGKQVIHPGQIDIVQSCFSPSKEDIEWASGLIREFDKQSSSGKGAFVYEGQMIDRPLLLQAKNIMSMSDDR